MVSALKTDIYDLVPSMRQHLIKLGNQDAHEVPILRILNEGNDGLDH